MDSIRYNRIKIVLYEMQLRQKDLIELIHESKDTISRWCRNKNNPSLPDLFKIAKVLRVDIRMLIEPTSWENEPSPSPVEILKAKREKENLQRANRKRRRKK